MTSVDQFVQLSELRDYSEVVRFLELEKKARKSGTGGDKLDNDWIHIYCEEMKNKLNRASEHSLDFAGRLIEMDLHAHGHITSIVVSYGNGRVERFEQV